MLTAERLRQLVDYDPETGKFRSKTKRSGPKRADEFIGSINGDGYVTFRVDGKTYLAHRLVWLYMTGEWPAEEVDHENRKRADNRWVNLRPADEGEQCQNRSLRSDNLAGVTGVCFHRVTGKYVAAITVNKKRTHLGSFNDIDGAAAAYAAAKAQLHTFQPRAI